MQESGGAVGLGGQLEGSRFNVCLKTRPYLGLSRVVTGKRECRRAPENYPARCFDPVSRFDKPIEQPSAGSFPGAACFAPDSAKQVIEQIWLSQ
jgi:hypothetical protein